MLIFYFHVMFAKTQICSQEAKGISSHLKLVLSVDDL